MHQQSLRRFGHRRDLDDVYEGLELALGLLLVVFKADLLQDVHQPAGTLSYLCW